MTVFADWLARSPMVAILRGVRPDEAVAIAEMLVQRNFTIIEVPLNSPDPMESVRRLVDRFGHRALIGAGTVMTPDQVAQVAAAGGRLIVMPHGDPVVVQAAKEHSLFVVPGIMTPTEAFSMLAAGADALKLFPAEALEPVVLKAMRAVLPKDAAVLPVGGITPDTMASYRAVGAKGFGLGSALYKPGDTPEVVAAKADAFNAAWKAG